MNYYFKAIFILITLFFNAQASENLADTLLATTAIESRIEKAQFLLRTFEESSLADKHLIVAHLIISQNPDYHYCTKVLLGCYIKQIKSLVVASLNDQVELFPILLRPYPPINSPFVCELIKLHETAKSTMLDTFNKSPKTKQNLFIQKCAHMIQQKKTNQHCIKITTPDVLSNLEETKQIEEIEQTPENFLQEWTAKWADADTRSHSILYHY